MKKILIILCAAVMAVTTVLFTGCESNSTIGRLVKAFENADNTAENIDNVDEEDLSSGNLNNINQGGIYFAPNIIGVSEEEQTIFDKIEIAIALQSEIKIKTVQIREFKAGLKISISNLKTNVKEFKASGYTLTDEDKTYLENYIAEVKLIYADIKDTIGNAYKKMYNLRGRYNLSNVDTIISTFTDVSNVLTIRVNSLTRLEEILTDINGFLAEKTIPVQS